MLLATLLLLFILSLFAFAAAANFSVSVSDLLLVSSTLADGFAKLWLRTSSLTAV